MESDKATITLPAYQWEAILRGLASSGWDSMHAVLSSALAAQEIEEPDWEYGVRLHPKIVRTTGVNHATWTPPTIPHATLARAEERARLNPRYTPTYHRRRKAGPWIPVEKNGEDT